MSEIVEYYRDMKKIRQREAEHNRKAAMDDYDQAKQLADAAGIRLIQHTSVHYAIVVGKERYSIYPGNRHILKGRSLPYLNLPDEWTLFDVVAEVIKQINKSPA